MTMRYLFALPLLLMAAGCCCPQPCCAVVSEATPAVPPQAETWTPVQPAVEKPAAEEPARTSTAGIYAVLEKKRVKGLDWEEQNLDQVVTYLTTISGLPFQISPKVREEMFDDVSISAELDDVSLRTLLEAVITEPYELKHTVRKGVVWIVTAEEVQTNMRLRYYDVKDLVGTSSGGGSTGKPVMWKFDELKAAELDVGLRKTVSPATWTRDDTTLEMRNGILIVRAPRDVLDQVSGFLDRKRKLTSK